MTTDDLETLKYEADCFTHNQTLKYIDELKKRSSEYVEKCDSTAVICQRYRECKGHGVSSHPHIKYCSN